MFAFRSTTHHQYCQIFYIIHSILYDHLKASNPSLGSITRIIELAKSQKLPLLFCISKPLCLIIPFKELDPHKTVNLLSLFRAISSESLEYGIHPFSGRFTVFAATSVHSSKKVGVNCYLTLLIIAISNGYPEHTNGTCCFDGLRHDRIQHRLLNLIIFFGGFYSSLLTFRSTVCVGFLATTADFNFVSPLSAI